MKTQLIHDIEATFNALLKTLAGFQQREIDVMPAGGGWTAGQCAEHIIKASSGIPEICNGRTESTERAPDQKIEAIKSVFLDFTQKFKSPDFIEPVETSHDLEKITARLQKTQEELLAVAQTHDLSRICKEFEVPGFGPFTLFEMISFVLFHTQRHTEQLKAIRKKLTTGL